jgi:hypothetical protein
MNYDNKYLKYKKKYLQIKYNLQIGGFVTLAKLINTLISQFNTNTLTSKINESKSNLAAIKNNLEDKKIKLESEKIKSEKIKSEKIKSEKIESEKIKELNNYIYLLFLLGIIIRFQNIARNNPNDSELNVLFNNIKNLLNNTHTTNQYKLIYLDYLINKSNNLSNNLSDNETLLNLLDHLINMLNTNTTDISVNKLDLLITLLKKLNVTISDELRISISNYIETNHGQINIDGIKRILMV